MTKRLIILLALLLLAVPLRAQWYLGGSVSFHCSQSSRSNNFTLRPDVGYSWGNWSFGASFAFESFKSDGDTKGEIGLEVTPYVEYYFWKSGILSFFVEGGCGFRRFLSSYDSYTQWTPYLKPCLEISLTDHWAVMGSLGKLEYDTHFRSLSFEMDNGVSVGLYYTF